MRFPAKIGPYTLIRRLAVGGMAEIFLAKVAGLGGFEKHLVLKVIHPKYAQDPEFVEMLIQEAKLVVRLNHVNIAQVFDLGVQEDRYYIAMEYVDGLDLYQLLRRARETKTFIPFEVASYIVAEIAAGLGYAHDRKDEEGKPLDIIHRDISPQNILVSRDGDVKIIDFGIAKARARSTSTGEGIIKGKFFYMSPEQARGEVLDHRSDIFSLGILFYELLTNRMLYDADSSRDALRLARAATFVPPTAIRADLPKALEDIVLKALQRKREARYSSTNLMRADLNGWLRKHSPGFRQHRLAEYLRQLFEESRQIELPSLGRREFVVQPQHSVIFRSTPEAALAKGPGATPSRGTRKVAAPSFQRETPRPDTASGDPFRVVDTDTRPRVKVKPERGGLFEESIEDTLDDESTVDLFKKPTAVVSLPSMQAEVPDDSPSGSKPEGLRAALAAWRRSQEVQESGQTPLDSKQSSGPRVKPSRPPDRHQHIRRAVADRLGLGPEDQADKKPTEEIPPEIIRAVARQEKERSETKAPSKEPPPHPFKPPPPDARGRASDGSSRSSSWSDLAEPEFFDEWETTVDESRPQLEARVASHAGGGRVAGTDAVSSKQYGPDTLDAPTARQFEPDRPLGERPRPPSRRRRKSNKIQWAALTVMVLMALTAFVVLLVLVVKEPAPPAVGHSTIHVTTTPRDGAEVFLDGVPTGQKTPALLTAVTSDQPHEIGVWLPGYLEAVEANIVVAPEERTEVELSLVPAIYSATISSIPSGAEILIDNVVVGLTPHEIRHITLDGKDGLRILLRHPGYLPDLFTIRWSRGETQVQRQRVLRPDH